MSVLWRKANLVRRRMTPVAAFLATQTLLVLIGGCESAAARYEMQARAIGQIAARETRSYIEQDAALLDTPADRARSVERVDSLERVTADADVRRLSAIEQAWADVRPIFQAYVMADPAIDGERRQSLLKLAATFDQLNRAERGRQNGWRRVQGVSRGVEPN